MHRQPPRAASLRLCLCGSLLLLPRPVPALLPLPSCAHGRTHAPTGSGRSARATPTSWFASGSPRRRPPPPPPQLLPAGPAAAPSAAHRTPMTPWKGFSVLFCRPPLARCCGGLSACCARPRALASKATPGEAIAEVSDRFPAAAGPPPLAGLLELCELLEGVPAAAAAAAAAHVGLKDKRLPATAEALEVEPWTGPRTRSMRTDPRAASDRDGSPDVR